MVSEVGRDHEPVNDLKSEACPVKAALVVHEPLRDLKRDTLPTKLEIEDNDPDSDLKMEVFSEKVDVEPIEADKYTVCPLKNEFTKLIESVNDLK